MKKLILILIMGILVVSLVGFVIAESENMVRQQENALKGFKTEIKNGIYLTDQGKYVDVKELSQNEKELKVNGSIAKTKLNISSEYVDNGKVKLRVKSSNGQEIEIKIMPDTASERALERLRLKVCNETNNCTIILKDVGNNQTELSYELQVERHYKLLGMFKTKAMNKAEIDAETGEVTITKKPWWAFLATKQDN